MAGYEGLRRPSVTSAQLKAEAEAEAEASAVDRFWALVGILVFVVCALNVQHTVTRWLDTPDVVIAPVVVCDPYYC
jgi:hypothetical protein